MLRPMNQFRRECSSIEDMKPNKLVQVYKFGCSTVYCVGYITNSFIFFVLQWFNSCMKDFSIVFRCQDETTWLALAVPHDEYTNL